jgi:hypothetical protein
VSRRSAKSAISMISRISTRSSDATSQNPITRQY